jgi:hypothetical protein
VAARAGQSFFAATATPRRGGITRAGQSGRGSWPRRRPPRRRGGTPDEPARRGVSGELRPRQRAQTHLATGRAKRARWRPPRRTRAGGRRARTAGTLATRVGDGPAARPTTAHARHRGPTPGWPVTTNSPRRHHAVSGEGWNPTASRTMAILPAALGWHHAPPNPRRQAAGELGACYTTAARRRRRRTRATTTGRTRDDGPQHGGPTSRPDAPAPPPPNPHPSPNPAPGAALSTTLAGQGRTGVAAWAAKHTPPGFSR